MIAERAAARGFRVTAWNALGSDSESPGPLS